MNDARPIYDDAPDGYKRKESFIVHYDTVNILENDPAELAHYVCLTKELDDFLANDTGFDFAEKYGGSPAIRYALPAIVATAKANVRKWCEAQKKALKGAYVTKWRECNGLDKKQTPSPEDFAAYIDGTPAGDRYSEILRRIELLSEHRLDAKLIMGVRPEDTLQSLVDPSSLYKPLEESVYVYANEKVNAYANASVFENESAYEKASEKGTGENNAPACSTFDPDSGRCPHCGGCGLTASPMGDITSYACSCGYQASMNWSTGTYTEYPQGRRLTR